MDTRSDAEIEHQNKELDKETLRRESDSFSEPNNDDETQLKSAHEEMDNTLAGYQETTDVTAPDKSKSLTLSEKIKQFASKVLGRQ